MLKSLSFRDPEPLSPSHNRLDAGRLVLHLPGDPHRAPVERYIREIYARRYGARVPAFAPMLLALQHGDDLLAAAGYRLAKAGPLFLEAYLDRPVEALISAQTGKVVGREGIVEVGHLATKRGGEGRRLIQFLGPYLVAEGFQWVVGTVTQELRAMLVRLGVAPLTLGPADPSSLGGEARHWGTYYEHGPVVLAIHLRRALRQYLARHAKAAAGDRW